MSADSQRVEILGGANHPSSGVRRRNPILIREGGGFVGLVGFAGTEQVDGMATRDWLVRFNNQRTNDDVGTYCRRLADTLTTVWQRDGLNSVLEILIAGEVSGDLQFWFVRNSQGLRNADWLHEAPASVFVAENDLDANYIPKYQQPGETKDVVLDRVTLVPTGRAHPSRPCV